MLIAWSHTGFPLTTSNDQRIVVTEPMRLQESPLLYSSDLSFADLARGDADDYTCMVSIVPRQHSVFLLPGHASIERTINIESKCMCTLIVFVSS